MASFPSVSEWFVQILSVFQPLVIPVLNIIIIASVIPFIFWRGECHCSHNRLSSLIPPVSRGPPVTYDPLVSLGLIFWKIYPAGGVWRGFISFTSVIWHLNIMCLSLSKTHQRENQNSSLLSLSGCLRKTRNSLRLCKWKSVCLSVCVYVCASVSNARAHQRRSQTNSPGCWKRIWEW